MYVPVLILSLSAGVSETITAPPSSAITDLIEWLRVVNDSSASFDDRVAAEKALVNTNDATVIEPLFNILDEPIGDRWTSPFSALSMYPGLPFPEGNRILPVEAQVVYARIRLWEHFAQHAQPVEDRKRTVVNLLNEFDSEFEFRQLMNAARWNHSPELEQKLWDIFADRELDASIRASSAAVLSQITHIHAPTSFRHYSYRIIEYAWEERGSELAMNIGGRGGGHPLQNVLFLDWYDREQARVAQRELHISEDVLDRIDLHFGNISGLYEEQRGSVSDKALAVIRQRMALQQDARATGDDTKLREFEAKLAERQRQELETRIERIEQWFTANRERLERDAEEYAARHRASAINDDQMSDH